MNLKDLRILNKRFGKKVVHVESIHLTYNKLLKHLAKHKSKCYCICPSNYYLTKGYFGIKSSKEDYYKELRGKYLALKDRGINLQLHVHLAMFPEELDYKTKEEIIKGAYDFFVNELDIIPVEIVFGWYVSDKDSDNIVRNLGLKIVPQHFHTYDWWLKKSE